MRGRSILVNIDFNDFRDFLAGGKSPPFSLFIDKGQAAIALALNPVGFLNFRRLRRDTRLIQDFRIGIHIFILSGAKKKDNHAMRFSTPLLYNIETADEINLLWGGVLA